MQSAGYLHAVKLPVRSGICLLLLCVFCRAAPGAEVTRVIAIEMGDYRFQPDTIELRAGEPVRLELTNTDGVTPHNFTLRDAAGRLDLDIDIAAGSTHTVELLAPVSGTYTFYCNKKLPFMKSHRDRGMQGSLLVVPANPR
jgi:plastocyanin